MSRTRNDGGGVASPVKKYLEYHGGRGNLFFYDSEAKKNVEFEKAEIILLDVRSSVTGWHNTKETKISSNLVKNVKKEELRVYSLKNKNNPKSTELATGTWDEAFKLKVNAMGGNFTANLFAIMKTKSGWELIRLELDKATLGSWAEFRNGLKDTDFEDEYAGAIQISRSKLLTKGGIKYYVPVFTMVAASEADLEVANQTDAELQKYFDEASGTASEGNTDPVSGENDYVPTPGTTGKPASEPEPAKVAEEYDDLPF